MTDIIQILILTHNSFKNKINKQLKYYLKYVYKMIQTIKKIFFLNTYKTIIYRHISI